MAIRIPCPICSGTTWSTHEDRHAQTRMDVCATCRGEGQIDANTGMTREASFSGTAASSASHPPAHTPLVSTLPLAGQGEKL